jgi:hypothetical protein
VTFRKVKGATKFGPQPARDVMHRERWECNRLADRLGVSYQHLYLAITGRTPASPLLRSALPAILNCKITDLFTEDSLAAEFDVHHHSTKLRAS